MLNKIGKCVSAASLAILFVLFAVASIPATATAIGASYFDTESQQSATFEPAENWDTDC